MRNFNLCLLHRPRCACSLAQPSIILSAFDTRIISTECARRSARCTLVHTRHKEGLHAVKLLPRVDISSRVLPLTRSQALYPGLLHWILLAIHVRILLLAGSAPPCPRPALSFWSPNSTGPHRFLQFDNHLFTSWCWFNTFGSTMRPVQLTRRN